MRSVPPPASTAHHARANDAGRYPANQQTARQQLGHPGVRYRLEPGASVAVEAAELHAQTRNNHVDKSTEGGASVKARRRAPEVYLATCQCVSLHDNLVYGTAALHNRVCLSTGALLDGSFRTLDYVRWPIYLIYVHGARLVVQKRGLGLPHVTIHRSGCT